MLQYGTVVTYRRVWSVIWGGGMPKGVDQVRRELWNADVQEAPSGTQAASVTAVLEQYKIYVEMADRTSARRGLANTYFLTLNTAVLTVVGVFWQRPPTGSPVLLLLPLSVLLVQCLTWYGLLRSYRQLNSAKYVVIGALEERLPASPYYRAEWWALREGKDRAVYWPLSHLEQIVPCLFALAYIVGAALVLVG